jgi:ribosomal protein S18 acetylase RimI-like enzyme
VAVSLRIRPVEPRDHAGVAALTVAAYRSVGPVDADYAAALADVAGRARVAEVLVAELVDGDTGRLAGSVTCLPDGRGPLAELARPGEATLRMLAVDPALHGHGAGEALVRACLRRAREAGMTRVVLCTQPNMTSAARLYRRLGFVHRPERDWSPRPDLRLLTFTLDLGPGLGGARAGAEQDGREPASVLPVQ